MRALILKDKKIPDRDVLLLENGLKKIIKDSADIDATFYREEANFDYYPTMEDSDGDMRPTNAWLYQTTDEVYKKYKENIDHIFIEIHEDKWRSEGIWGTNYSNAFNGYQVHYCRFDKFNQANTLGTAWHEYMHSPDAFVAVYGGVNIESYLKERGHYVSDWDKNFVHGKHPEAKYIRHKENTEWLERIKEPLQAAYQMRKELYLEKEKEVLRLRVIALATKLIVLLRQKIYRKRGVRR
jgi:hypothetical protein